MVNMRASDEAKRRAFGHLARSINADLRFPAQVFQGSWSAFLFFESDRLFASGFTIVVAELLSVEQANVCCLLTFSETKKITYESAAMLFIDAETEQHTYDAMLRKGGPASGWLFGMDRYGSASDKGGWSIYCEKGNDVAVIALRQLDDMEKYAEHLKSLHAEPITTLIAGGSEASVPFGQFTESWCRSLTHNYADGRF